jgi:hypothetical protein
MRSARWAFALLLGLTIAACSPPPPVAIDPAGTWATRTVDDGQVSLSVPGNWSAGEAWIQASSFTDLVASFSNQSLSPPCTTAANSISCGPPLASLQPGAMLVDIYHDGSPQWTIDSQPGSTAPVSGLQARVTVQAGAQGYCSGMGADRSRREIIAFADAPDNYFEIDICSRGVPAAVGARILESLRVTPLG